MIVIKEDTFDKIQKATGTILEATYYCEFLIVSMNCIVYCIALCLRNAFERGTLTSK